MTTPGAHPSPPVGADHGWLDDFSTPDKAPHIAISVDMLDTGIDIPEVVNLVSSNPSAPRPSSGR